MSSNQLDPETALRIQDGNDLNRGASVSYIYGALVLVIGLGGLFCNFVGISAFRDLLRPVSGSSDAMDVTSILSTDGNVLFVYAIACSVMWCIVGCLNIAAASNLKNNRRKSFLMLTAIINCMIFPFGTALGVYTLVVLNQPSVRALFL